MNLRDAATILGRVVTTADVARALGASPHSVRQARLVTGASGYRHPPEGWQRACAKLARKRIRELERLVTALEKDQ